MEKILEVIIKEFAYEKTPVLKDIHFDVNKGECLLITGLSGSGKSTLLKLINRLIPDVYEGKLKGDIKFFGKNINSFSTGEISKYMANVFQDLNDQFFADEVSNEVALIGENMGMDRNDLINRVDYALKRLSIKNLKKRKIRSLSGGQKHKVGIVSSLIYDSDIIILDEPSSSLDYKAIEDLKENIRNLKKEGKTIIIVDHRLYYLRDILDRMLVLKEGHLENIYKSDELDINIQRENNLRCLRLDNLKAKIDYSYLNSIISIENLLVENKGYKLEAKQNFTLSKGECMAIVGKNGIGKSTLVKQLIGLLDIKNGETSFGKSKKERLKNISTSLQNCSNMFFYESVEKELIPKEKLDDKSYLDRVRYYLKILDLWDKRLENPHDLSGGERQRLAIIIALLKESKITILDEPTSGLDFKRMDQVSNILRDYSKDTPIIMVTHDLEVLFKTCNTALLLGEDYQEKVIVKGKEDEIIKFLSEN